MKRFDVTNEVLIPAEPAAVYQALLAELRGDTHWWLPDWEANLLPDSKPMGVRGAITDVTIHHLGHTHVTARVMEAKVNEEIDLTFEDGAFIGYGEWKLKPIPGGTRVRFHWVGTPHRLLSIASVFVDLGKCHYRIMRDGLENLATYLGPQAENDDTGLG